MLAPDCLFYPLFSSQSTIKFPLTCCKFMSKRRRISCDKAALCCHLRTYNAQKKPSDSTLRRQAFSLGIHRSSTNCSSLLAYEVTTRLLVNMLQSRSDISGLEILAMALSLKILVTLFAVLSVIMVSMVYALLIRRGGFMSTTAIFPTKAIKSNIGSLLSAAWPDSTDLRDQTASDFSSSELKVNEPDDRENSFQNAITLFYLGRMKSDKTQLRVAKGVLQSAALPIGNSKESRLWLTSGSPTTKCTIQLLIWEWISVCLMLLMLATVLAYNGFFTNERNLDSYPRLIIILIYMLAFCIHAFHTWRVSLRFFTKVSAGCSWSLIERGNFAVTETTQLNSHIAGEPFQFCSIDKASEEHTPRKLIARFKHEIPDELDSEGTGEATSGSRAFKNMDESAEDLAAAHKTLLATQITERDIASTLR